MLKQVFFNFPKSKNISLECGIDTVMWSLRNRNGAQLIPTKENKAPGKASQTSLDIKFDFQDIDGQTTWPNTQ